MENEPNTFKGKEGSAGSLLEARRPKLLHDQLQTDHQDNQQGGFRHFGGFCLADVPQQLRHCDPEGLHGEVEVS